MLIVTASDEDHLRIKSIVDEADQLADGELVTQVYHLKWANPTALSTSIKPIAPQAIVSPDVSNKTLIVTATAQDQERIKPIVEQADRRGEGELSTKVYAFKLANPATIATALATLMPNATLSSDTTTNTLIVTASAEDHQMIEPLVTAAGRDRSQGQHPETVYGRERRPATGLPIVDRTVPHEPQRERGIPARDRHDPGLRSAGRPGRSGAGDHGYRQGDRGTSQGHAGSRTRWKDSTAMRPWRPCARCWWTKRRKSNCRWT